MATGCGDDGETATKTVTAPAETVTVTEAAPAPSEPTEESGATGPAKAKSAGQPLPAGVVGVDGRYLLETANQASEGANIGDRFFSYEEPSNAVTTCSDATCSVEFRLGLKSGGSKAYTLEADAEREGTYVGTFKGQVECAGEGRVPSRERIAVRAGSATEVRGRQVAGRLSVFITTTATCDERPAKSVVTLRGPREP